MGVYRVRNSASQLEKAQMCIHTNYTLYCTACGKQFSTNSQFPETQFEEADDAKEAATDDGWTIDHTVANGSDWDFCPHCWTKYNYDD